MVRRILSEEASNDLTSINKTEAIATHCFHFVTLVNKLLHQNAILGSQKILRNVDTGSFVGSAEVDSIIDGNLFNDYDKIAITVHRK